MSCGKFKSNTGPWANNRNNPFLTNQTCVNRGNKYVVRVECITFFDIC